MRKLLTILVLGLGMALQGCYQPVFAQTSNYGGVSINGSYTTNCIPLAVTAVTLQCSAIVDNGTQIIASPGGDVTRLARTTNAQTLEIYSTTDSNSSPVNYERARLFYNSGGAAWTLNLEKGGSGTARALDIGSGGNYSFLNGVGGSRSFIISPGGKVITYGQASSIDAVVTRGTNLAATAQVASLGATNVVTSAAVGLYRVCYQASTTTSGTGTTGTVTIAWNDGNAKSFTTGTWALNAVDVTGQVNGCQVFRSAAAQAITVATTIGAIGTSVYRVDASAEQLQ